MALAVSVSPAGVPVAGSDHSPSLPPEVFFERTRTVYCVALVRVEIVAEFVVALDCRDEENSCKPDFHCTS